MDESGRKFFEEIKVQKEKDRLLWNAYQDSEPGAITLTPEHEDAIMERMFLVNTIEEKQKENELLNADKELLKSKWEAQGLMIQKLHEEQKGLDYNEVFKFMKEFGVDFLNRYKELIIDEKTNTFTHIEGCNDLDDIKTRVVYAMCRPIGKGLEERDSKRLLNRVNEYFKTELTKEDMLLMYQKLCYPHKFAEFRTFIKLGFPMDELKGEE